MGAELAALMGLFGLSSVFALVGLGLAGWMAWRIVAKAGLADAVDGFCEGIAFSVEETRRVFEVAKSLGLPVKLHAEQLSNLGGSAMAASIVNALMRGAE